SRIMGYIWILFLVSWFLYPGAYLMPLWDDVASVVGRQINFTAADILSKVIYGILLTQAAQIRSREEDNYDYDRLIPTAEDGGMMEAAD
ncbi:MAG: bacteriorhodopsin, partial [Chloroflexota bacterium]